MVVCDFRTAVPAFLGFWLTNVRLGVLAILGEGWGSFPGNGLLRMERLQFEWRTACAFKPEETRWYHSPESRMICSPAFNMVMYPAAFAFDL